MKEKLDELEQVVFNCNELELLRQAARQLLTLVHDAYVELNHPAYMYAGGRINRQAILFRNAEILLLREQINTSKTEMRVKELVEQNNVLTETILKHHDRSCPRIVHGYRGRWFLYHTNGDPMRETSDSPPILFDSKEQALAWWDKRFD